ncbi:hypothetical protein BJX61DRAFT_510876 [Aspergillus egyptiacus]|nr:hypothetical protein BJX61DRAFT_510876 [Aspergillus egyptiacus]
MDPTGDTRPLVTGDIVSARGRDLEPNVPVFFDVLNNLWDPVSNLRWDSQSWPGPLLYSGTHSPVN